MTEPIIIAIISGLFASIPSVIANVSSNRKTTALMNYKIDELDKKVHEHNNLIDRTYKLESRVTVLEEKNKEGKK